jgi:hypothetical protein
MKKIFLGKIIEITPNRGFIEWNDTTTMKQDITDGIGKSVKMVIEDKKRTLPQNALYWAYLHIISRETGNDIEELHYSFRFSFLEPQLVEVNDFNKGGKTMVAELRSTTSLSKQEFTEYLERICAETGIPIPNEEEINSYFEE